MDGAGLIVYAIDAALGGSGNPNAIHPAGTWMNVSGAVLGWLGNGVGYFVRTG
jgi:hypothetical protein